ncbi:MAG: dienelactone hydrolase family protein, partial [Planctomycetota bacterium]
ELRGEEVEVGGMDAYLSTPTYGEPLGGVLVIHEWWGLNEHVKHWADRLASDGYVALAVDLYDGVVATTRDGAMEAMRGVDKEAAREKLLAAHEYLVSGDGAGVERTACIGWCFGGGWSLETAIAEPELDAGVIYYGRLVTDVERLGQIEASMLGVFGNEDRGIPPSAVEEFADAMESAGKDLTLRQYDANHAFANPSSGRYDAENASAAWSETRAFLYEHLQPAFGDGSIGGGQRVLEAIDLDGWTDADRSQFTVIVREVDGGARCTVSALGGDGGGLAPNLNRWRAQLGAGELSDDEIDALPTLPLLGRLAPSIRIEGTFRGMRGDPIEDAAMLGAVATLESETVFVKLVGPREAVDAQREQFAAFCRGLR